MDINHFFRDTFDDTTVEPMMMENKKWARANEPNWKWIKKEIERSEALFVLLTKNVVSKIQTRNWMSFEIGVAAAYGKPVYVFNEEAVDFPLPYLNHYFPDRTSPAPVPESGKLGGLAKSVIYDLKTNMMLRDFIRNPQLPYPDKSYICHSCKTVFNYWKKADTFYCPCCKHLMLATISKYHYDSK